MLQTVLDGTQVTTSGRYVVDGRLDFVNRVLRAYLRADVDVVNSHGLRVHVAHGYLQLVEFVRRVTNLKLQSTLVTFATAQTDTITSINVVVTGGRGLGNRVCDSQSGHFRNLGNVLLKVGISTIQTKVRSVGNQDGDIGTKTGCRVHVCSVLSQARAFRILHDDELVSVNREHRILVVFTIVQRDGVSLNLTPRIQRLGNLHADVYGISSRTAYRPSGIHRGYPRGVRTFLHGLKFYLAARGRNVIAAGQRSVVQLLNDGRVNLCLCCRRRAASGGRDSIFPTVAADQLAHVARAVLLGGQLDGVGSPVFQRYRVLERVIFLESERTSTICLIGLVHALGTSRLAVAHAAAADNDLVSSAGSRQGTIQQIDSVEIRAVCDTIDFVFQGSNFLLQVLAVHFVCVCSVRGLVRQFHHTVQHGVDFRHGTLGRLHQRNTIVGILLSGIQTGNLCTHLFRNGQSGSVIASAVDSVARGKFLQVLGNGTVVHSQVTIRV